MYFHCTPNVPKALLATRFVLKHLELNNPLVVQAILFEADVNHVGKYGRQIYGERWAVSWEGPRATVFASLIDRDPAALSLLEWGDATIIREIGYPRDGSTMDLELGLGRIMSINHRRGEDDSTWEMLSESDQEELLNAVQSFVGHSEQALKQLTQHPALRRSNGIVVTAVDMLDPEHPDHKSRARRVLEEGPATVY